MDLAKVGTSSSRHNPGGERSESWFPIMRGSRLAPLIISTSSLMPLCSLLAGGGAPPLRRYEPRARAYCGGRYLAGRRHHRAGRYLAGRRYHTPVV